MRGRSKTDWWGVVLEAPDAQALADFYSYLLGWPVSVRRPERGATLAGFQPQEDVRVLYDPAGHPFCLYFDHDEGKDE